MIKMPDDGNFLYKTKRYSATTCFKCPLKFYSLAGNSKTAQMKIS